MPSLYLCTMHVDTTDTICALGTPAGAGAIAMVRICGPRALELASSVFSRSLHEVPGHSARLGLIRDGERVLDEAVALVFRGPHSFTGEDTVEFNCHGSLFVQQAVLQLLVRRGCRMARPGEFSMRAYLNGRMDLSQAEAIGDLVASETDAAHRQAMHQMRGGFSREITMLRDKLIHFASLVELELDFAEEDVEFANRPQLLELATEIGGVVDRLRDSFSLGNAMKNGVPVAILGAPNMGKSTLLNALLNEERAIVSDIAGTTRDTVEDHVTLEGIRFRFIDTAGIRETTDTVERLGIERSFAKAREARILLWLTDPYSTPLDEVEKQLQLLRDMSASGSSILVLANKMDRVGSRLNTAEWTGRLGVPVLAISALTGAGLDELRNMLVSCSGIRSTSEGETIVTNLRHYEALTRASESIREVIRGLSQGVTGDFLAIDIRRTLYFLGEITGEINADDLLNSIFSRFCIGK